MMQVPARRTQQILKAQTSVNMQRTVLMCFQNENEVIRTWIINLPQGYENFIQPETRVYFTSIVFLTWLIEVWPFVTWTIEISHKIQPKPTYRDQWNTKLIKIHLQRNLCRCLVALNAESLRELEYRLLPDQISLCRPFIHLHGSRASVTVTTNREIIRYLAQRQYCAIKLTTSKWIVCAAPR